MRFLRDEEKDQLKKLVKSCMLEISQLKMNLNKCQEEKKNSECPKIKKLEGEISSYKKEIIKLKKTINKQNKKIKRLKKENNENSTSEELDLYKFYIKALTAKPKPNLTSFQSQMYSLFPNGQHSSEDILKHIKNIGFTDITNKTISNILYNLERKNYYKSFKKNDVVIWEKIEK